MHVIDNADNVLTRVPVRLSSHAYKLRSGSLDVAFLFELARAADLRILSIVNKAAWEGIVTLEGRTTSCDQQNMLLAVDYLRTEGISRQSWVAVNGLVSLWFFAFHFDLLL